MYPIHDFTARAIFPGNKNELSRPVARIWYSRILHFSNYRPMQIECPVKVGWRVQRDSTAHAILFQEKHGFLSLIRRARNHSCEARRDRVSRESGSTVFSGDGSLWDSQLRNVAIRLSPKSLQSIYPKLLSSMLRDRASVRLSLATTGLQSNVGNNARTNYPTLRSIHGLTAQSRERSHSGILGPTGRPARENRARNSRAAVAWRSRLSSRCD